MSLLALSATPIYNVITLFYLTRQHSTTHHNSPVQLGVVICVAPEVSLSGVCAASVPGAGAAGEGAGVAGVLVHLQVGGLGVLKGGEVRRHLPQAPHQPGARPVHFLCLAQECCGGLDYI